MTGSTADAAALAGIFKGGRRSQYTAVKFHSGLARRVVRSRPGRTTGKQNKRHDWVVTRL
jgi:hypothetical protein